MFFQRLFKERPAKRAGQALFASAVAQARRPEFYADLAAPDTLEGRFEIYSLHVTLLILRLRGQGPEPTEVAQTLFDAYMDSLDIGLREIGVGDLSMGKKMKKLGQAFYGRIKAYGQDVDQPEALRALISRTVYEGGDTDPGPMAAYVTALRALLARQPTADLVAGHALWPEAIL